MRRYWLIGVLLVGALGLLPSRSVSAPSLAATLQVVIELQDEPAAVVYAAAQQPQSAMRAAQATQAQMARIETAQQRLLDALKPFSPIILYRIQRVYNGIAAIIDARDLDAVRQLPGVKAIHPLISKSTDNWHSVPLIGAPQVWEAAGLTGENVTIGIIDSGIDYVHADFGGLASTEAYAANDTTVITDTFNGQPLFPTAKVVGGRDFVGDAYTGGGGGTPASVASDVPQPDPDPAPCTVNTNTGNHGTHVAGTAAGFGVNADGSTYTGTYHSNLSFTDFTVGPGVAPQALLYSLRVFGCNGDSTVVDQAIEWAVDPNQDGDFSDHLDVINMSLGAPYGADEDSTAIAANNAVLAGVIVVAAAGNNGDAYYIVNSPGSAARAISVAGSDDGGVTLDGYRVITPSNIAGVYGGSQSTLYDWLTTTLPITAQLVYPEADSNPAQDQRTGCYTFNLTNTHIISGNIVLLNWTEPSCGGSVARVTNAANAGARGVLLMDNLDLFHMIISGGSRIPAYGIPKDEGDLLQATLAVTDVYVAFTTEYQGSVKRLEPTGENVIYSLTTRGPRRGDSALKPDLAAPGVTIYSALNRSGNKGYGLSGTSMATPHVSGMMALLRQRHPDWSVADLKALAMNTATTDLTLGALKYDPGRVGAGRVVISHAVSSPIIAYDALDPHLVSVSFGAIEVTDTLTLTRAIQVSNKSAGAATYSIGFSEYVGIPGAAYAITPTSIWLPPHAEKIVSITLHSDAAQLRHTRAPTVPGGDRAWLSEASGYVVLTPIPLHTIYLPIVLKGSAPASIAEHAIQSALTWPSLRVPVYAAVRPASQMHAAQAVLDFTATTTTTVSLLGYGVNTGAGYPTDTLSLVAAFELAEVWPNDPGKIDRAELKYLGAGNNFGATGSVTATTLFFAIATQGSWSVPLLPEAQFKIFIDTDRNGADDFVLSNDTLSGQSNDVFYSRLTRLSNNAVSYPLPLNYFPASTYDVRPFNTNVLILAVPANAVGLTAASPTFRYRVGSYAANSLISASAIHTYTAGIAGLDFSSGLSGTPVWSDLPGATIPVGFNTDAYTANGSIGALLLHLHNVAIDRRQVIPIVIPHAVFPSQTR